MLKNLYSKNCMALDNNIYARLCSPRKQGEATFYGDNMVYDYGGKFLSRWRSRKQIF